MKLESPQTAAIEAIKVATQYQKQYLHRSSEYLNLTS